MSKKWKEKKPMNSKRNLERQWSPNRIIFMKETRFIYIDLVKKIKLKKPFRHGESNPDPVDENHVS